MRALNLKLWAVLPIILLIHSAPTPAQTVCDAAAVKLGNNFIQVAPTGSDDTANIQCALDLAVEKRIPEIRLTRGDFFISSLSAQNLVGTLQGGGRDHTRLNVLDRSVDCAAMEARGEATAAIKFAGGEPRVRWLTLAVDPTFFPCATGGSYGGLSAMVHFTGHGEHPSSCRADVIYGTIDRANLDGPRNYYIGPQAIYTGVLVAAEASGTAECRNSLLGSIKINRSLISGFARGAWLIMGGNAQVSVLNNDFDGNHVGLRFEDSNAVATVFGNRFSSKAPGSYSCCESGGTGIGVLNTIVSTGGTRLDIRGNTFEISSSEFDSSWGIRLIRSPGAAAVDSVVSGNHFRLGGGGNLATAVSSYGVSGGFLNDNLLTSYLQGKGMLLYVNADIIGEADHWTVVSNRGLADMYRSTLEDADVHLGGYSSNTLIGQGQAAIVRDEGIDNIVLPQ